MSGVYWKDREKYGLMILAVLAVVAFLLGAFTDDGSDVHRVTIVVTRCSNPDLLRAAGTTWESSDAAPASWGDGEQGQLSVEGDKATFTSDADGRTITFRSLDGRFSSMPCRIEPRP